MVKNVVKSKSKGLDIGDHNTVSAFKEEKVEKLESEVDYHAKEDEYLKNLSQNNFFKTGVYLPLKKMKDDLDNFSISAIKETLEAKGSLEDVESVIAKKLIERKAKIDLIDYLLGKFE